MQKLQDGRLLLKKKKKIQLSKPNLSFGVNIKSIKGKKKKSLRKRKLSAGIRPRVINKKKIKSIRSRDEDTVNSSEEIDNIVAQAIADKLNTGQLNECDLTIADLHTIRTAFVDILQGVHHPRIKYPGQKTSENVEEGDGEEVSQKQKQASESSSKTPAPSPTSASPTLPPATSPDISTRPSSLVRRE